MGVIMSNADKVLMSSETPLKIVGIIPFIQVSGYGLIGDPHHSVERKASKCKLGFVPGL